MLQQIMQQVHEIQATNIYVNDWFGPIQLSAIYSPPKHSIKRMIMKNSLKLLLIDFWLVLIATPNIQSADQLKLAIDSLHLNVFTTGAPTYWPTDINKTADLIDFFIGKGLASTNVSCDSCYDLSLQSFCKRTSKRN